ncbi:MAG TPA: hypothetical protein VGK30_10660 [Candidatus Binatia bacterium]|jgi:hypothetical protein
MLRSAVAALTALVATAGSAHAATVMVSGALSSAGGTVTCEVVNAGKKTVGTVTVAIVPATQPANASSVNCQPVLPDTACPATFGLGAAGDYYCKVTIDKGNKKDFRATFCDVASGTCSEVR